MALLSLKQFQELIDSSLNYNPRRDRLTGEHPSGEIETGAGNTINSLRLKFLIEDDGGLWDGIEIVKPEFIWDMKKIVASSIIDVGAAHKNANLSIQNVSESDDGLVFHEMSSSRLVGDLIPTTDLNFNNTVLNIWFRPYKNKIYDFGYLFILFNRVQPYNYIFPRIMISIGLDPANSGRFCLRVYIMINDSPFIIIDKIITGDNVVSLLWEKKYNCQVVIQNFILKVIINGHSFYETSMSHNLSLSYHLLPMIGANYNGEISYISLSANGLLIDSQISSFWKMGYPLPRDKEYVDLSDYFETNGRNLLIEARNIDKAIENLKGQLYVKSNTVKLKDI